MPKHPTVHGVYSMIRTVFWDIGGVLLTNGLDRHQRARVYAKLQMSNDEIAETETLRTDANWFWERGLIDDVEFFKRVLFFRPRAFTLGDVWQCVKSEHAMLHPECMEMLKSMHARRQVRVATLNNESRELNVYRLDHFGLRQYFDFFVCSAYVHEMKPAPGIYRSALEISGDSAGQVCFIDDTSGNITAANEAGFAGIHFTSPAVLRAQLDELGVAV